MLVSAGNSISNLNPFVNQTENHQAVNASDKSERTSKAEQSNSPDTLNDPQDEYNPGGNKLVNSAGIYRLEKDETGRQTIIFDRPASAEEQDKDGELPEAAEEPEKSSEKPEQKDGPEKSADNKDGLRCTVNTDKVDAEIKRLKEEKKQIELQLQSAQDDKDKRKDLEKRLSQVEAELSAKDNEAYRKQNATYTYG